MRIADVIALEFGDVPSRGIREDVSSQEDRSIWAQQPWQRDVIVRTAICKRCGLTGNAVIIPPASAGVD